MRASGMASEPETLDSEHKPAQQAAVELWPSGDGKKAKNSIRKGKAKHELKAVGDFFEGEDGSGNEGTEAEQAEEQADGLSVPAEVSSKRKLDKSTIRVNKHPEKPEKHSKKPKHKKHRGQATAPTPIIQDSFFGDDRSD